MKRIRLAAAVALVSTAIVVGAASPASALDCASRTLATPFTQWGDRSLYFAAATFESGTDSWRLRNGALVSSSQNQLARRSGHALGLGLPAGSTATSPAWCVFTFEPTLRFFYSAPSKGAQLRVDTWVRTSNGVVTNSVVIKAPATGWQVSPIIALPDMHNSNGQQSFRVTMTPIGTSGTWQVDDVMIDPWISR